MDSNYDCEGASKMLQAFAEERYTDDAEQFTKPENVDRLQPVLNEKPKFWRFILPTSKDTQQEELVLSLQGIITQKELPPLLKRPNDRQQSFIRQSVQITGLNTKQFQTSVDTLQRLHQAFSRQVLEGSMDPFVVGQCAEFDTIEFSTRYFTSRHDDPFGDVIPFDSMVDPRGVLASMTNSMYFHGEDNRVAYFMLKHNGNGRSPRFERVDPTRFRIGDVVEVQATVIAVPIRNNRFKMILQLRALALLDGRFTDKAATSRAKSAITTSRVSIIKRKIGYETADDEVSEARRGIVNMNMNEG